MDKFENKPDANRDGNVPPITGESVGIDVIITSYFIAQGAYVFITGHCKEMLDELVRKIKYPFCKY
jgi:NADP-dependent 3-hydroxy acid dehydrogenase YdfG